MNWFRRSRPRPHDACIIYCRLKYTPPNAEPLTSYYSVVCRCGWFAEPIDSPNYPNLDVEVRMRAALHEHQPDASTTVFFPLDDP